MILTSEGASVAREPRARISEAARAAVAADLRATSGTPEGAYRRIARRHEIGEASVRRIAEEYGIDAPAAARAKVEKATEQRALTNAERRAALAERLLAVAQESLDEMEKGSIVTATSFGAITFATAPRALPRDRQALMTAAAIALDKHRMLDQYDSAANGAAAVDAWLRSMTGGSGE